MKYFVVTSWSEQGHELYGKKWIESFQKYWPDESAAFLVTDPMIYQYREAAEWFAKHKDKALKPDAKYNYRHDLLRFAHKIWALQIGLEEAIKTGVEWLVWLDGDVETVKEVTNEDLAKWLPDDKDVAFLSRKESWDHPECGFVGYHVTTDLGFKLLRRLIDVYRSDEVLSFAETHDSHVFARCVSEFPDLRIHDLCPRSIGLEAFGASPLKDHLVHHKGARKLAAKNVAKGSSEEEAKRITGGSFGGNVILKTRNCRPESEIRDNIAANFPKIKNWLRPVRPHQTPLILISAGESLKEEKTLQEIRDWQRRGASIWCVKHSHNFLLDQGIVPYACVLLDPRPHTGPSTHGFAREDMLAKTHPKVKYFMATMCDPTVLDSLLAQGADVWGWNAAVGAEEHKVLPKNSFMVPGGSTSVMRGIAIGYMMGYRMMVTYAMDSCHFDPKALDQSKKNPDGSPKYFEINVGQGNEMRTFLTDRDLLAQAQDVVRTLEENKNLELECRGPGMVPYIWWLTRGRHMPKFEDAYGFGPS